RTGTVLLRGWHGAFVMDSCQTHYEGGTTFSGSDGAPREDYSATVRGAPGPSGSMPCSRSRALSRATSSEPVIVSETVPVPGLSLVTGLSLSAGTGRAMPR